jgi:hypothetical protein
MRNRGVRYQELARVQRERDRNRRDAEQTESVGMSRLVAFLYRRALRIGALSVVFLTLLASAVLAAPMGPDTQPTGTTGGGVTIPVSDGGGSAVFWIVAAVALAAGVAALIVDLNRQRAPKAA